MSFLTDVAEGFAALIAADADPAQNVTWQPDGSEYAAGKTGIYLRKASPVDARCIVLTAYGLGDDSVYGDTDLGLQVISRSADQDPTDADTLDDLVADILLGRHAFTLPGGVYVQKLQRTSGPASLGQDDNQRWSLASNYGLTAHRPGPHRL